MGCSVVKSTIFKADEELENLFSGLTLKTPIACRTSPDLADPISTAADSDNDNADFEDCISSLPTSPQGKKDYSALLVEHKDDDDDDNNELVFSIKNLSTTRKDDIFAEELPEFVDDTPVSSLMPLLTALTEPLQDATQLMDSKSAVSWPASTASDPIRVQSLNNNVAVGQTETQSSIVTPDPIPDMLVKEAASLSLQADTPRAEPQFSQAYSGAPAEEPLTSENVTPQEECHELVSPPSGIDVLTTEPSSPPILTKGTYNFDFVENSDPFGNGSNIDNLSTTSKPKMIEADPFKTSTAIGNSPIAKQIEIDPLNAISNVGNSTLAKVSEMNPFNTKTAVVNSPIANPAEFDPFKTKSAVANSPVSKSVQENPFETKSSIANSPAAKPTEENPFKTKSAIANSPVAKPSQEDPFKTKSAVANSPVVKPAEENPFKTKSAVANSPVTKPVPEDPFKTKSAIENSPMAKPAKENPFKTKSAIANSPVAKPAQKDPFKTKSAVANSPVTKPMEENPFNSKSTVTNSPVSNPEQEDPFKTKSAVANSPLSKPSEENPFKTITTMTNSPQQINNYADLDPFKATKTMLNSPPTKHDFIEEDIDPFKPRKAMMASPPPQPPAQKEMTGETMTADADDAVNDENVAPGNQPKKSAQKKSAATKSSGPKRTKFKRPPKFAKKSGEDDAIEIFTTPMKASIKTSVPSKNAIEVQPETIPASFAAAPPTQTMTDPLDFDDNMKNPSEEEFVAASDFLDDSAAWEMLNKFGSEDDVKLPSLGRESLYIKFDPLINETGQLPPQHPVLNETATWDMLNQYRPSQAKSIGRESLYVRFDPLVKTGSPGLHRVSKLKTHLEIPENSEDLLMMTTPPTKSMDSTVPSLIKEPKKPQSSRDDLLLMTSMVAQSTDTTTSSVIKEEPAPKLLSFNSPSPMAQTEYGSLIPGLPEMNMLEVLKYSQWDMTRMTKELETQYEAKLQSQSKELELQFEARLLSRERAMAAENEELIIKMKQIRDKEEHGRQKQEQMALIVTEYEINLEQAICEMSEAKTAADEIKKERDQALEDIKGVETFCSNLHVRYEKLKASVDGFKQNEAQLKKFAAEMEARVKKSEQKYVLIKQKAEEKIENIMTESKKCIDDAKKTITRLDATNRKVNVLNNSLQQQLDQKVNENAELMKICDELLVSKGDS